MSRRNLLVVLALVALAVAVWAILFSSTEVENWLQWGTVGEWVGGLPAAAALGLTGWALLRETRDRKEEATERRAEAVDRQRAMERQNRLDEERRRQQALGLVVDVHDVHRHLFNPNDGTMTPDDYSTRSIDAIIKNDSDSTYYDGVVGVMTNGYFRSVRPLGTMRPRTRHDQTFPPPHAFLYDSVVVHYTDHVGRRWQQDHEGRLSEVLED